MPQHIRFTLMFLASTLLVSGCGVRYFSDRETNPATEDYISEDFDKKFGLFTTRPDRRSVFVNLEENSANYLDVCAEPPADAAEAFAKTDSGKLKTGAKEASLDRAIATSVGQLTRRSQGLQWMRDQMFYLCLDRMNGTINNSQYYQLRAEIMRLSVALIQGEIPHLPDTNITITAPAAPSAQPSQ